MLEIICSDQDIDISTSLQRKTPTCIFLEPFTGKKQKRLFTGLTDIVAVCEYLDQPTDAFPLPGYINKLTDVRPLTYMMLIKDRHGFVFLFCLSHQDQFISLEGFDEQTLLLHTSSGSSAASKHKRAALVCLRGTDLYQTIEQGMQFAMEMTGKLGKLTTEKPVLSPWIQTLGWESGAALGKSVSHEKILQSVHKLREAGYQPGFVLIDEGWQHSSPSSSLMSFEADPIRFPSQLKGLTKDLSDLGVKHVGVWHGMMGGTAGIHSQLAAKYALPQDTQERYFLGPQLGNTFEFYYDYYNYLRHQGVTFIKVGDQSNTEQFSHGDQDCTLLHRNLQGAMQAAASIHFNSAHFNTDCLRNENLFYWTTSGIARIAHDIDLTNPNGVMRTIRNNLLASLWMQYIMQPDFDVWTGIGMNGESLAVLHALSGSINVVSDLDGDHHRTYIKRMVLPCGIVLKADQPLTLCQDSVFIDPIEEKQVYKAFTMKGECGILAAFNLVEGKTLHGQISSRDVHGLKGDRFAVFSFHNGFLGLFEADESIAITLKAHGNDIFTFAPEHNGIAVMGSYLFYLSPGPILEVIVENDSIHISSLAGAPIIIYCERDVFEVRRNGVTIPWEYDVRRKTLTIDTRSTVVNAHSHYTVTFEN